MRYYEFSYLIEGYPQTQAAFVQAGADAALVQKSIADFKQLVTRNQIKDVDQKNIDWWAKQGWDKFNAFVNQAITIPSKTQVVRKKLPGQSINLVDNADWLIVIPLDKDASCFYGKDSDWCTTKIHQGHFETYFYKNEIILIYCFNKSTGGMWAIAVHKKTSKMELFDQRDRSLSIAQFKQQTGLDPKQLQILAMSDSHRPKIQATRDEWKESVKLTERLLNALPTGTRSAEIEKQLAYNKSGVYCAAYIEKIGHVDSNDFPLAMLMAAVSTNYTVLQYIKNQKPILQLAAVSENGYAIEYIAEPSEQVQLAAVSNNGNAIQFIIDAGITPSEQVQSTAVSAYGNAIISIIGAGIIPNEKLQLAAVSKDGYTIYNIIKVGITPSEQVQLAAVSRYGPAIDYIIKAGITPSEQVQLAAVSKSRNAIKYIINAGITPSIAVRKAAHSI